MIVKGWSVTAQEPPAEISEDGVSMGIVGMT